MLVDMTAHAQEEDAHEPTDVIIVTGQVIQRTLNETPASVSVLTSEAIEDSTIIDVYEMFNRIPNVSSSFSGEQFVIRGVAINGPANVASGSLSNIYLDGVPLTQTGLTDGPLSAWDLEQAEFFRGSQSTNQGRNAMAGAIVLTSKTPDFDYDAHLRFLASEYGTFSYQGAFGGGLIEDVLAFRVAASLEETDGPAINVTRDDDSWDEEKNFFVRGKLLFQPGGDDRYSFIATALYAEKDEGSNLTDLTDPGSRISFANEDTFTDTDSILLSGQIFAELSEKISLRSITGYTEADLVARRDNDNGLTEAMGMPFPDFDLSVWDESGFTQELKLSYNSNIISGVIGGYFADLSQDIDNTRSTFFGTSNTFFTEDTKNYAFFAEADTFITDAFTLTTGIRYDKEDIDYTGLGLRVSAAFSAWLPKVGLAYQFNDNVRLSAFVNKGYRAGGAYFEGGLLSEYDPEFTWNYELALRTNWADGNLLFNANVFYTDWTDQQVFFVDEFFRFGVENAAGSNYYGFEFELATEPVDGLMFFANYGHTRTEFEDYQVVAPDGRVLLDLNGNEFRYAPRHTFSTGVNYNHDSGLFLNVDVSYSSSAFTDEDNTPTNTIDGRIVSNAKAGYDFGNWSVFAQATNLFDEEYLLSNINFGGISAGAVGQPQTFGGGIEVHF